MTLERIVDIYSSSIGEHLVSRRVEEKKEGPFKGVKTYRIELWDAKEKRVVFSVDKTCQITAENKTSIVEDLEYEFIERLFNLCT